MLVARHVSAVAAEDTDRSDRCLRGRLRKTRPFSLFAKPASCVAIHLSTESSELALNLNLRRKDRYLVISGFLALNVGCKKVVFFHFLPSEPFYRTFLDVCRLGLKPLYVIDPLSLAAKVRKHST